MKSEHHATYVGRFAPSPTGPLHFGSLLTAVASYCEAKSHHGRWLVRIEDTDIPRICAGSVEHILRCIDDFAFEYDGSICYQQHRLAHYEFALDQLKAKDLVYACQCPRKILGSNHIYAGTCRDLGLAFAQQAIRLKVDDQVISFVDQLQGPQSAQLSTQLGDFVLKRRDGIINYQLAVVVDDHLQGVTHVVRGADLLDNTERQIYLGSCLDCSPLSYMHIPLAMNHLGQKLSKQNLAQALDPARASQLLFAAITALGQPSVELDHPRYMLAQAVAQWQSQRIPAGLHIPAQYS